LNLHGWVSSLLQVRPSLVLAIGSTAESGFINMRDLTSGNFHLRDQR
jgi:hypothetical protein